MEKKDLLGLAFCLKFPQFREKPCTDFEEFAYGYLGIGEDIYPEVMKEGKEIVNKMWDSGIKEIILYWGIGSGKSTLATILTAYVMHILLCLKNPHEYLGLMNDKPIAVVNMGVSAFQAKNVVFTGLSNLINNCAWFQNFDFEALSGEIRFFKVPRFSKRLDPQKANLVIYCGNSKETMPVGMNVYSWIVDEFAFFLDTEEKSNAKEVRDMLKNRQTSRFGLRSGLTCTISSARYSNDAMDSIYANKKNDPDSHCSLKKTWEAKDPKKMSKETFNFVAQYDDNGKPVEIWENIPMDFYKASQENAEKFMRDFGCKPSLALEPFDRDAQVVVRNVNFEREDPLTPEGKFKDWFVCQDSEWRYAHIDLALKKDSCGIAVGRPDGFIELDGEERPRVFIDLIMRITAPEGGEIMFSDVRQVLYSMIERKFKINYVTFDGWQSADSIQILNKRGIEAELLSVDRDTKAYDTLKALLHLKGIDYYRYTITDGKGEKINIFEKEYMSLESIKAKKVDHPDGGSKDVSDAVAGMVWNVVEKGDQKPTFD